MSLVERLKKLLATVDEDDRLHTEEVEEEEVEKGEGKEIEKAEKPADKPKLVRKQITLGARPINVNLEKEVERFNK